jgi:hypothetical protein
VISETDLSNLGPDRTDDTGDLVTEHGWHRTKVVSGKEQIGVTQPGGLHLDENFPPNRCSDVNVVEIEATTERVNDQRLHDGLPAAGSRLADFLGSVRPSGFL